MTRIIWASNLCSPGSVLSSWTPMNPILIFSPVSLFLPYALLLLLGKMEKEPFSLLNDSRHFPQRRNVLTQSNVSAFQALVSSAPRFGHLETPKIRDSQTIPCYWPCHTHP